jgi:hypothetical protein
MVPPFSNAIRRFVTNAAEMKKLAGRDFEDLLIVSSIISALVTFNLKLSVYNASLGGAPSSKWT